MPNELNNNRKPMDYGRFFEEKRESPKQELTEPEDEVEAVGALTGFWSGADRKTKIELSVLLAVVVISLGFLLFYFLGSKKPPTSSFPPLITPPAEEAEMFNN